MRASCRVSSLAARIRAQLPLGDILHYENGSLVGPPSPTHFTPTEQQLMVTLWCVTGAPMFMGGRLPTDAATLALLTNWELLYVHDAAVSRFPIAPLLDGAQYNESAWVAITPNATYIALLNAYPWANEVFVSLGDAGLSADVTWCSWDAWQGYWLPRRNATTFSWWLPGHGGGMFRMSPCTTVPAALSFHGDRTWVATSPTLYSAFVEDINHAVEGGLSAQLVRDYTVNGPIYQDLVSLRTLSGGFDYYLQHCDFVAVMSSQAGMFQLDATWQVVRPGVTGQPGTVSFASVAGSWPGWWLTLGTDGQLHLTQQDWTNATWNASATYTATPVGVDAYVVTLTPTLPGWTGYSVGVSETCTLPAGCTGLAGTPCLGISATFPAGAPPTPDTTWLLGPAISSECRRWAMTPGAGRGASIASRLHSPSSQARGHGCNQRRLPQRV